MAKRTEFPAMEVVEGGEEPSHHDHCHGQQGAANCHRVPGVIVLRKSRVVYRIFLLGGGIH